MVQRFGDIKKLITQTLGPLLSAYFRDIAHKKTILELLHDRDKIQKEAKAEKQMELTNSKIQIEIAENQSGAELSRASIHDRRWLRWGGQRRPGPAWHVDGSAGREADGIPS